MDISTAILIIGFAAVIAAFFLLVIGLVYSEMMNSDIPQGVANRGKLHVVHGLFVGISIVVSIYGIVIAYYFMFYASQIMFKSVEIMNYSYSLVKRKTCLYLNTKRELCSFKRCLSFLCNLNTDKASSV